MKKTSYFTKVVGVTFEGRQEALGAMRRNTKLRLRQEPENPVDSSAIAVDARISGVWVAIGYIAATKTSQLNEVMMNGEVPVVALREVTGGANGKNYGANISISYGDEEEAVKPNLTKLIPTIGEGYVMFDAVGHVYYDEDGNQMVSGSVFDGDHKPEVDFSYPAAALAKTTGVSADEILALWDDHKNIAADYGKVIHKALEIYINNVRTMETIDKAKQRVHSARHYMPETLGSAVNSFFGRPGYGIEYAKESSAEVFVRYKDHCGFIDMLHLNADGSLTMHDHKAIRELKEVKYAKYGKQNMYTLQQNFYREIVENCGEKVSDMVLEVYDSLSGDWTTTPVKRIDL